VVAVFNQTMCAILLLGIHDINYPLATAPRSIFRLSEHSRDEILLGLCVSVPIIAVLGR
jgi:hypothetical protein